MSHLALNTEERQKLFESLASGIDHSGLNLDEFIFASSELLKTHFWMSITQGMDEEEVELLRERLVKATHGVVQALEGTTQAISEDMIVLYTVALEAVNQIFVRIKEQEAAASQEAEPVE